MLAIAMVITVVYYCGGFIVVTGLSTYTCIRSVTP